jgi:hypothetical protein
MPEPKDDEIDIILLPPLLWDDLPKFEPIGTSGFIRRETLTRDELAQRFPDLKLPAG